VIDAESGVTLMQNRERRLHRLRVVLGSSNRGLRGLCSSFTHYVCLKPVFCVSDFALPPGPENSRATQLDPGDILVRLSSVVSSVGCETYLSSMKYVR
jgi:hypothetical protein